MKYCKYCKTKVDTTNDFCPLCFNHMEELDKDFEQFYTPRLTNEKYNKHNYFIFKLFLFLSISAIIICFVVNRLVNFDVRWWLIVTFAILYVWILVAHTIMSRQSLFKKIFLQIVSILALLYFTQQVSNSHEWLLDYVFPSISFMVIFVLSLLILINKDRDSILGFAIMILLLGVGSLILLLFNFAHYKLLNFINLILCGITILAILIFGHKAISQYLSKKFHL